MCGEEGVEHQCSTPKRLPLPATASSSFEGAKRTAVFPAAAGAAGAGEQRGRCHASSASSAAAAADGGGAAGRCCRAPGGCRRPSGSRAAVRRRPAAGWSEN